MKKFNKGAKNCTLQQFEGARRRMFDLDLKNTLTNKTKHFVGLILGDDSLSEVFIKYVNLEMLSNIHLSIVIEKLKGLTGFSPLQSFWRRMPCQGFYP